MTVRGTHGIARRNRLATAMRLGLPVFHGLRCDHCRTGLHDEHGNPRWDVVGKHPLLFICPDGCKEPARG